MAYRESVDTAVPWSRFAPADYVIRRSSGGDARRERVQAILTARRARARWLDADLFFDPVWDMLLELYASHLGQFDLTVSNLCAGSAVPATTALRWISVMERRGLVWRKRDPLDKRRVYLHLSQEAAQQMNALFEATPSPENLI